MKLTEHVYMISGVSYKTNSNTYAILAGEEIILIDTGYSKVQWDVMEKNLNEWGLQKYPITHVFLTHVHFDHAGNTHFAKEKGAQILIGEADAKSLETAGAATLNQMTEIFPDTFIPCKADKILQDNDIFEFEGVRLKVISAKGHSEGAKMFLVTVDDKKIIFTGDNLIIGPDDAKDNILVDIAWCGGPGCSVSEYLKTLRRGAKLDAEILAPGHYYPYYGSINEIFSRAADILEKKIEEM